MKAKEDESRDLDLLLKPNQNNQMDMETDDQSDILEKIQTNFASLQSSSEERIKLINRARELLEKHIKILESQMPPDMLPPAPIDLQPIPKKKLLGGVQLYCICQQVSYGEMIGCDNNVLYIN